MKGGRSPWVARCPDLVTTGILGTVLDWPQTGPQAYGGILLCLSRYCITLHHTTCSHKCYQINIRVNTT